MLLDEVQRRNRRRVVALAVVSAINHWVVVSLLVAWFGVYVTSKTGTDDDIGFGPIAVAAACLAAAGVALYIVVRVRGAARATVRELGAVMLAEGELPRVQNLLHELAIAAGTPPLAAALLDDEAPNALTVGAGPASTVVVVTTGLVETLRRDELEAVLAAQVCAVQRLDVAVQTIVVVCSGGAIAIHESFRDGWKDPRSWFGIALTWPTKVTASVLRRVAFRACDYGADDMAVAMTRHPQALRRALERLLFDPRVVRAVEPANAPLWFEPVPDGEDRSLALGRYSMTPSLEDRIARLPTD